MPESVKIAVIGGSGLYKMPEITDKVSHVVTTPFGSPSAEIVVGTLRGKRVAFIPRHGLGHIYTPTTVPYRANIYALKSLGARFIIGVNACGSLREDYAPGHLVIPDQLYDHTKADRGRSFFDTGLVGHVSVANPLSPELGNILYQSVQKAGGTVHQGGTFIIIEGPRFSTRGESNIYRQWGCSLIGMTTCPEAFLACESEVAYATLAHVTDYDVWHTSEEPVTVEMVIETLHRNVETAHQAIANAVEMIDEDAVYDVHNGLAYAMMTERAVIPQAMINKLKPIVGRYLGENSS
jgi:5'-methylthioadenosine phosphorylase